LSVELGDAIDPVTNARVHALDRRVAESGLAGIIETVPAYASLLVHLDPLAADFGALRAALERLAREVASPDHADAGRYADARVVEIPVRYGGDDGPDLAELAEGVGLTEEAVVERHAAGEYRVAMLGFAPGFPYLMGLDASIAYPRLETPRVRVPAGSVAIAEQQTGVYPYAMPGGWRLIGRTDTTLFDPFRDPPALVMPGDQVRFVRADDAGAANGRRQDGSSPGLARVSAPAMRVLEGGIQSTVQDAGRFGYQRLGVPPSGAADPLAFAAANDLVGNPSGAAAIEIAAGGFEAEVLRPVTLALTGARLEARLGGREIPFATAVTATNGERLLLGRPTAGLRTYLALGGGVDVPVVLGSRSTYLPARFGGYDGRALRAGDELGLGSAGHGADTAERRGGANAADGAARRSDVLELPFVASGQWDRMPVETHEGFPARPWTVSHRSDRMGLRLEGQALSDGGLGGGFVSRGTVTGAIQLSGDGLPIILGVDRQTTGGYPMLGAVAATHVHLLGQLQPGDEVRFRAVSR